jgi:large subunit ribosomal protein L32
MRRSHHHIDPKQIRYCPRCEQPVLPHRVCGNCGHYKGHEVFAVQPTEK